MKKLKLTTQHKENIRLGMLGKQNRLGCKSSEVHKKKISKALKGRSKSKLSQEVKDKISKSCKGKRIGKNNPFYGKKHTEESLKKMSEDKKGRVGAKASNWQGGITPLSSLIRHSSRYKQWRTDIFIKDNYTCQKCGKKGCYLEAHHKTTFAKILKEYVVTSFKQALNCSELWDINNGQTLCKDCHNLTKNFNPSYVLVEI